MKTWNRLIGEYIAEAFERMDLSEYEEVFGEMEIMQRKDEAISFAEDMFFLHLFPDDLDADAEAPEDFERYISLTAIENYADKCADEFEEELLHEQEMLEAEADEDQIQLTPEEKRELKLARMVFFDPIEEAEIHS